MTADGHRAAEVDWHRKQSGSGSGTATWTFTGLAAGDYRVSATWAEKSNRANDAPFTILDNAAQVGSVSINQRVAPDDFNTSDDGGTDWEDLGGPYTINSGTLVVQLNESPGQTGQVLADAIRIEEATGVPDTTPPTADLSDPTNGASPPRSARLLTLSILPSIVDDHTLI